MVKRSGGRKSKNTHEVQEQLKPMEAEQRSASHEQDMPVRVYADGKRSAIVALCVRLAKPLMP